MLLFFPSNMVFALSLSILQSCFCFWMLILKFSFAFHQMFLLSSQKKFTFFLNTRKNKPNRTPDRTELLPKHESKYTDGPRLQQVHMAPLSIATPADLSLNHYTHAAHQAQKERLEGEILIWLQQRKPWFLYNLSHWKWKWAKHKTDKKLTHALKFKNWLHTGRSASTVTEVCYHQFISWSHSLALVWLLSHL